MKDDSHGLAASRGCGGGGEQNKPPAPWRWDETIITCLILYHWNEKSLFTFSRPCSSRGGGGGQPAPGGVSAPGGRPLSESVHARSRARDLNLFCFIPRLLFSSVSSPRRNVSTCHRGSGSQSVTDACAALQYVSKQMCPLGQKENIEELSAAVTETSHDTETAQGQRHTAHCYITLYTYTHTHTGPSVCLQAAVHKDMYVIQLISTRTSYQIFINVPCKTRVMILASSGVCVLLTPCCVDGLCPCCLPCCGFGFWLSTSAKDVVFALVCLSAEKTAQPISMIHPLGAMNICSGFGANPPKRCWLVEIRCCLFSAPSSLLNSGGDILWGPSFIQQLMRYSELINIIVCRATAKRQHQQWITGSWFNAPQAWGADLHSKHI